MEDNPLSFLREVPGDFLYPSHNLDSGGGNLELWGNYKDIFREKKENGDYNYLNQPNIGMKIVKIFEYGSRKSAFSFGGNIYTLLGDFPSAKLTQLNSPGSNIMIGYSTTIRNHKAGIAYKYLNSSQSLGCKLDPFPVSEKQEENDYLFNPLKDFFGTEYNISGQRSKNSIVIEDEFNIIGGHSADIRLIFNSEEQNYALQYTNSDSETNYIDIPMSIENWCWDINYYYELNNKWLFKFLISGITEGISLDILPRAAAPEKDITSFGDTDLTLSNLKVGGGAKYIINEKTETFLKINYGLSTSSAPVSFATPVLGKIVFIPIVHRLIGTGTADIPIWHIQAGYSRDISEKVGFCIILDYLFSGTIARFQGEAQLTAGLDNYQIDENLNIHFGLIHLNPSLKYNISSKLFVVYNLNINVPYYTFTRAGYEPPPSDDGWKVRGGGGFEHALSFAWEF